MPTIQPKDIETALGLTGVVLYIDSGRASITANETVTDAMQARVQAWHDCGEIRAEYVDLRAAAYLTEGVTPEALAIAIAEKDGEGRPEAFNALAAKRAAIKARYPKP
jgi:pyrroloquinoline quinone (PQQ) biosynthesis protein C